MSYSNYIEYCLQCHEVYNIEASDSNFKTMYCSKDCENKEQLKLEEGNRIIESAKINEPLNLRNLNLNEALNTLSKGIKFSTTKQKEQIEEIVKEENE